MDLVPLLLLSPVLVAVAYCDLRYMRIPNKLVLIAVALFVLTCPLLGLSEIGWRLVAAGVVLAAGFAVFALRLFGGGDVKMLAALMLFVPSTSLVTFAYGLSASLILGVMASLLLQSVRWSHASDWVSVQAKGKFPMGISIALAGLIHPALVAIGS